MGGVTFRAARFGGRSAPLLRSSSGVVGWNTVNSIALGFRSNDRAGPPPFGRQAGVPTPALKHPYCTHSRQYMSETGGRVGLGQQSTARRATQHAEAERRRDLCDVVPTSPVHTLFLAQSLIRRATQNGSHCDTARRSLETTRPLRRRPYFPCSHTFSRPVTVQAGDTERLTLFPPPEITLSRGPVGLLGLSPNRRTPCGRCRVPRQRSYVAPRRLRN